MDTSTELNGIALDPHDLLWVSGIDALTAADSMPAWATADWLSRAPVVVRRERTADGSIPVGLRGSTRSQRCKAYLSHDGVARCVKPETLAHNIEIGNHAADFAALAGLKVLAPLLNATGLTWGPTGGVGFMLASGLAVLRPDSDLDLVVRTGTPLDAEASKQLRVLSVHVSCRLDIQIDTGHGAFSFAEWSMSRGRVLLKTDTGPFLTDDPWNQGGWLVSANEAHAIESPT